MIAREIILAETLRARGAYLSRFHEGRRADSSARRRRAGVQRHGGNLPALFHSDRRCRSPLSMRIRKSTRPSARRRTLAAIQEGLARRHARLHRDRPRAAPCRRKERGVQSRRLRHQRHRNFFCALIYLSRESGRSCRLSELAERMSAAPARISASGRREDRGRAKLPI